MPRTMYDSIVPARMPRDAEAVAGYTSGLWPTFALLAVLFPNAFRVSIAVTAAHDADVLDVESGDARPADVPAWCVRQRAAGRVPIVYASTSMWPFVKDACRKAGVALPLWWEAHYDGRAVISPGSIGKQYKSTGGIDTSIIADTWPGLPGGHQEGADEEMAKFELVQRPDGAIIAICAASGAYWHVPTPAWVQVALASPQCQGPVRPVSQAEHDLLAAIAKSARANG